MVRTTSKENRGIFYQGNLVVSRNGNTLVLCDETNTESSMDDHDFGGTVIEDNNSNSSYTPGFNGLFEKIDFEQYYGSVTLSI